MHETRNRCAIETSSGVPTRKLCFESKIVFRLHGGVGKLGKKKKIWPRSPINVQNQENQLFLEPKMRSPLEVSTICTTGVMFSVHGDSV